MKTKLLLIALSFGMMSGTCSTEDEPIVTNDCECEKIHYEREQTGWAGSAPVYTFVEVGREQASQMDCNSSVDEYTFEGNAQWFRIVCE